MNFTPVACSSWMVRIWSSCADPVPPIFIPPPFSFDRGEVVLRRLVRRLGVDPQDELVEGQPRDRRQVLPVERHAGVERRREQIRQRDDDGLGVTLLALDVQEALRPRPARLVDDDDRLGRELVLLGDARDQPRHLVGATAGPRRDHELDGLGRLPRRRRPRQRQDDQRDEHAREPSPETSPETSPVDAPCRRPPGQGSRQASSHKGEGQAPIRRPGPRRARQPTTFRPCPSRTGSRRGSPTWSTSRRPWPGNSRCPPR